MSNQVTKTKILERTLGPNEISNFNTMVYWTYYELEEELVDESPESFYGTGVGSKDKVCYDHEWVNVSFNHIKYVCKKCDKEKESY